MAETAVPVNHLFEEILKQNGLSLGNQERFPSFSEQGGNWVGRRGELSSEALESKQENKRAIRNGFVRQSKASEPI